MRTQQGEWFLQAQFYTGLSGLLLDVHSIIAIAASRAADCKFERPPQHSNISNGG
ncbi:MAG: hypothetical protein ABSH16_12740 [Sedimentisphaerales bacterium]